MSEPSKDGVDKGEDGLTFESSAFEALERDFGGFAELVGDKSLERFRSE